MRLAARVLLSGLLAASVACRPFAKTADGKIVGGSDATFNAFPYMVSLQAQSGGHFCGGTYLGGNLVLTAAHCAYVAITSKAVFGEYNFATNPDLLNPPIQSIAIGSFVRHPNYNPVTLDNDIAVARLVSTPSGIPTVQIASALDVLDGVVIGWGLTNGNDQNSVPSVLQMINISFTACDSNRLCATNGACFGDSGGPVMTSVGQVGIVSSGNENCTGDSQMTDVTQFLDFISAHMNAEPNYSCHTFQCPNGTVVQGTASEFCLLPQCDGCGPSTLFIGDGYCDTPSYNNPACGFDGGDCCEATCQDDIYLCGENGFDCRSIGCTDSDALLTCQLVGQLNACDQQLPDGGYLRDICPTTCEQCCTFDDACTCNNQGAVAQIAAQLGAPFITTCTQALEYIPCDQPGLSSLFHEHCPCQCCPSGFEFVTRASMTTAFLGAIGGFIAQPLVFEVAQAGVLHIDACASALPNAVFMFDVESTDIFELLPLNPIAGGNENCESGAGSRIDTFVQPGIFTMVAVSPDAVTFAVRGCLEPTELDPNPALAANSGEFIRLIDTGAVQSRLWSKSPKTSFKPVSMK